MIFISSYMYIIDSYEVYAASALTFLTLIRYCFAGGFTVVGIPFYRNVGHHWTVTILACLSLLLTPIPYVFYKYGHIIRKKSRFAVNRSVEDMEKSVVPDSSGSSSLTIPIEKDDMSRDEGRAVVQQ